jgi:lysophospholipase L1-like esterase
MNPRRKRALFWGVTILLPFALLASGELLFRATGWFAPEPLFLEVPDSRGAALKFNPWVTRRYFDSTVAVLPHLSPQTFSREKRSSTIRLLCLGESTTAGFPFESQVPFPAQLREILARAYPRHRVEVLNAGISAISSYVVIDLLPELLRETQPDAVVIYLGHNEFYGVYGSGSTIYPGKGRAAVSAVLALQHFHLVQMLKRGLNLFRPRPDSRAEARTLMQNVVGEQEIVLGSEMYRATMATFRENMESIIGLCRTRGVPVLVGGLVSNERDQPPFRSPGVPAADAVPLLRNADSLLRTGRFREAEIAYRSALAADSGSADARYGIGRAAHALGDSMSAAWFIGAKERDGIRFRGSEEANAVLESTARAGGAGFVNLAGIFRGASPGGSIGHELMCDHLHPNPQGYYLMARSFYDALSSMGVLGKPDSAYRPPRGPYGVTDLDWEIGLTKIFPMLHEWPFREVRIRRGDYRPHGDSAATRIALLYHRERFAWVRAHDMMAREYLRRREPERAMQEYAAVAAYQPDDPWPHQQIAAIYEGMENWTLRSAALQEALLRSPVKGMIAYQLALSEWKLGHLGNAIQGMEFASGAPDLNRDERLNARFFLAGFHSDNGHPEIAVRLLRALLAEEPSFAPARAFLERLERKEQ